MSKIAAFTIGLSAPAVVPITVHYATQDGSALRFTDYGPRAGTITFAPGESSKVITIPLLADPTRTIDKVFRVVLSDALGAALPSPAYGECRISGTPTYSPVSFPGRRALLVGDSITALNHYHGTAQDVGGHRNYFANYLTNDCGWFTWAQGFTDNRLELEPALQPNLDTVNTWIPEYNHGYNTAIGGSTVMEWANPTVQLSFQGLVITDTGPMTAALSVMDKVDIVFIFGGTNDLSRSAVADADIIVDKLKAYAYIFASAGKWVILQTIAPRARGLMTGYTMAERIGIQNKILSANQQLRDWIATNPANIWLVDHYNLLVGPNGVDPAGLQSSTSDSSPYTSVGANYRSDAPGVIMSYDDTHPTPAGAEVMGAAVAQKLIEIGVPVREAGMLGPCTLGSNLLANPNFTVTGSITAAGGVYNKLGFSTCLGSVLTDGSHPSVAVSGGLEFTNVGLGYQHGQVPDDWIICRANNDLNGDFQNFLNWGFLVFDTPANAAAMAPPKTVTAWVTGHSYAVGDLVLSGIANEVGQNPGNIFYYRCDTAHVSQGSQGVRGVSLIGTNFSTDGVNSCWTLVGNSKIIPYRAEPGWSFGSLTSSIVSLAGGVKGLKLDFATAATGRKNESFYVRAYLPRGQHGLWDVWMSTPAIPTTPYSTSQPIAAEATLSFSNMTKNVLWAKMLLDFESRNITETGAGNNTTKNAIMSGGALAFGGAPECLDNSRYHTRDKTLVVRTPAVYPPVPISGETQQIATLNFQFAVDASTSAAAFSVIISKPNVQTVTPPLGGL